jgi:hypothetical protein
VVLRLVKRDDYPDNPAVVADLSRPMSSPDKPRSVDETDIRQTSASSSQVMRRAREKLFRAKAFSLAGPPQANAA